MIDIKQVKELQNRYVADTELIFKEYFHKMLVMNDINDEVMQGHVEETVEKLTDSVREAMKHFSAYLCMLGLLKGNDGE